VGACITGDEAGENTERCWTRLCMQTSARVLVGSCAIRPGNKNYFEMARIRSSSRLLVSVKLTIRSAPASSNSQKTHFPLNGQADPNHRSTVRVCKTTMTPECLQNEIEMSFRNYLKKMTGR